MIAEISKKMQSDASAVLGLVIVGAGPAGLASLLAAAKAGILSDLLAAGVLLIDRECVPGAGRLGQYVISSDSSADTFLSCVRGSTIPELANLTESSLALEIASYGHNCIPLELAGQFMAEVGKTLIELIANTSSCRIYTNSNVEWIQKEEIGTWKIFFRDLKQNNYHAYRSKTVLIATGATQDQKRLERILVDGISLLPRYQEKLVQSDEFLRRENFSGFISTLDKMKHPKVAIIGGSTSAMSCARQILIALKDHDSPVCVSILHRRDITLFYSSRQAAQDDGYNLFDEEDICPLSGFVHRFGGFRFESRILASQLLGMKNSEPEPRVTLHRLNGELRKKTENFLEEADLVIACIGYRPAGVRVIDRYKNDIKLASFREDEAMVNNACRVLDWDGKELPGLYGIGLACGYRPPAEMGGEPSFRGQVNGLWLWQNDVGFLLINNIMTDIQKNPLENIRYA